MRQHDGFQTVDAVPAHFPELARTMRQAERVECAALGYTPMAALECSLAFATRAWTGLVDGVPVCMFGVTATMLLARTAEPWLLSTDGIMRHRMAFLRANKPYVREMLDLHPHLAGMVHAANTVSIRWLRWMGFAVGAVQPWGPFGALFRPFEMRSGELDAG